VPTTNYCPECGAKLPSGAAAECFQCHARFDERPAADEARRAARRGALQGTLLAAGVIIGVLVVGSIIVSLLLEVLIQ
jgi:hypothetical protein